MSNDRWNLNRVGRAAAVTTALGQVPQYGLAFDLGAGSAPLMSTEQFQAMTRDMANRARQEEIAQISQQYQEELEKARNFQEAGWFSLDRDIYRNNNSSLSFGYGPASINADQIMTGINKASAGIGSAFSSAITDADSAVKLIPVLGTWLSLAMGDDTEEDVAAISYEKYRKLGGILSESDFGSFDPETQVEMMARAEARQQMMDVADTPGIKQALATMYAGYRGAQTPFIMKGNMNNPLGLDPAWFSRSAWGEAWRESQDQSLGNAIVNSVLEPYVGQEKIDRWKRDNSAYQLSSLGVELGASWYADPAVIASKTGGNLARYARFETPLNEQGWAYRATSQALQREQITVGGPITQALAKKRAKRIQSQWEIVGNYARSSSLGEFSKMRMFRHRDIDGEAAAAGLHWAFNNSKNVDLTELLKKAPGEGDRANMFYPDIESLTQQMLHGDPKAYADFNRLKNATPEELNKFAPGAQTFIDAIDSTKTRIKSLEREADELEKIEPNSPFHEWSIHTEIDARRQDIMEAQDHLRRYEDYEGWLTVMDNAPRIERVSPQRGLYMQNQFGQAHFVSKWTRPLWLQKANVAEMHDIDSGVRSLRRQSEQFDHLMGYRNPEALDDAITRWSYAKTPQERHDVMRDFEETHLIQAAAQRFNVEPAVIRAIYDKSIKEQNKIVTGIRRGGDDTIYSTAPDSAGRLADANDGGIKLVEDHGDGMVTIQLMSNGRQITTTVHESALSPRGPIDPTQTANYYQPVDTRRFFLELKRHEDIIEGLNMRGLRHGEAAVAEMMDKVGSTFNALWKPAVLFRFGWPLRVLMDEQARALAVLGAKNFTRYYGSAEVKALNNAGVKVGRGLNGIFNAYVKNPVVAHRFGRDEFTIGPGPVRDRLDRTGDPVIRDAEKIAAPVVPESFMPMLDNARFLKLQKIVGTARAWQRADAKRQAWQREVEKQRDGEASVMDNLLDEDGQLNPRLATAYVKGLEVPDFPETPGVNIVTSHGRWVFDSEALEREVVSYDPITGKPQAKTGWAVPIPGTEVAPYEFSKINVRLDWFEKHAEMLASTGYRIIGTKEEGFAIARVFQNRQRQKAYDMAEFVETGKVYDLTSGKSHVLKDWNDLTPAEEAAQRYFISQAEYEEVPGNAPYGGPKRLEGPDTLFHGAQSELPEPLLPRDVTPIHSGRMIGEGFYTTTSREIAEGYNPNNLYTIRGARDGKTYHIFDLDRTPSKAEQKRFLKWLREHDAPANDYYGSPRMIDSEAATFYSLAKWLMDDPNYRISRYSTNPEDPWNWADLLSSLDYQAPNLQKMVTRYLEEVHGAGALRHTGGFNTGTTRHHVYVWLKPEELEVKPLYVKSDKYVPLVDWLGHPDSREVPIPENRIVRTGKRNPMFRELNTIHAQRQGLSLADPEARKLVLREQELMNSLGLDYADNVQDRFVNNAVGQDWYVMVDKDKWNRTMAEAHAENAAFDEASRVGGDLRSQEVGVDQIGNDLDFDFDLDDVHGRTLRSLWKRREYGKGYRIVKDADGVEYVSRSAYEGHKGELMRSLISSQGSMEALSDGHGAATSLFRRLANGQKAYNPPAMTDRARMRGTRENKQAVEYFHQWSELLNSQIANSPIWSKMLKGWDDQRIVDWLDNTPEGGRAKREIMHEGRSVDLWVWEHREKLDYYLPNKKLQRLLSKGQLQPSDLRKHVYEDEYPTVFGPDVEFLDRRTQAGRMLGFVADRMWYALGTVPVDTLSRHPFARAMYEMKMDTLVATTKTKWLDEDTLARYEQQSWKYARDQVRKTLWDLTDQTNFADALRFMSPFWAAQSEALVKWARIISDRPETVARVYGLNRAIYQNFMVVDEEGNPTPKKWFDYTPTDRVVLRIPESLRKGPLGQALLTIGSVGIPLGSANTVLQGETPVLPGPGPLVTVPADKFLRATNDIYGTSWDENSLYRWLFPIGRPQHGGIRGILDQVVPGWGKRVMAYNEGEGGVAYANLMTETARELEQINREKGLPPPTPEEIEKQARWVWGLRTVAGLVMPFQTQFRPKNQFFIDEAHRYQREYGLDWFDRFVQDHGLSMARYAVSSSNSTVGVPPTSEGMEEWAANKQMIQKFPHWGDAIISPDAYADDFSSDAYYAQFDINLGPGDDTRLRESQSQRERFDIADSRAGWYEFRQVDAILDAQLAERGLSSIQQNGAEDLAQIKSNFIADLTQRNPAWREEYNNFTNDIYSRVAELEQWAFRPEFDQRPDIQGVRQYLMIRDEVAAELDRYAAETGGSRSLQAEENAALRQWFYTQVGQLTQANPAFAEFYSRHLSADTLTQGSGGF